MVAIINNIWQEELPTKDMQLADIALVYEKGSTEQPENYRPIALLNTTYKTLASIIQRRLAEGMDHKTDRRQFRFRKARSTSQALFIYRRVGELHGEPGTPLTTLLLDWEKPLAN